MGAVNTGLDTVNLQRPTTMMSQAPLGCPLWRCCSDGVTQGPPQRPRCLLIVDQCTSLHVWGVAAHDRGPGGPTASAVPDT
jgi:hypothetical protein